MSRTLESRLKRPIFTLALGNIAVLGYEYLTDLQLRTKESEAVLSYKLLWMAGAGAAGTLARYTLGRAVESVVRMPFPWGVMTVNLLGCFLFGLVWAYTEDHLTAAVEIRMAALTGFMGAFTTFSTLIFDTGMLLKESQWILAMANIFAQNILGLGALALGFVIVRQIW